MDQETPAAPSSFADQLQGLDAMRVFMQAIPAWMRQNGRTVHLKFTGTEEGVECDLGFPADEGEMDELTGSLMDLLQKTERLQRLQFLIEEFREAGMEPTVIDLLVAEAESLVRELHPEEDAPPL